MLQGFITMAKSLKYNIIIFEQLPFFIGIAVAYKFHPELFDWLYLLVLYIAMLCFEFGAMLLNDYFDFKSGNDVINDKKSAYAGGSDALSSNSVSPSLFLGTGLICMCIAMMIGLLLVIFRNPVVLLIGISGIALGVFYTAPPFKFAYRGFGEFSNALAIPLLILGVMLVMVPINTVDGFMQNIEMFKVAAMAAIVVTSIHTALQIFVEFPDYEADKTSGKNNLIVRLGIKKASLVFLTISIISYLLLITGIIIGLLPWYAIIACFGIPLSMSAFKGLVDFGNQPEVLPAFIKDAANAYLLIGVVLFAVIL